MHPVKKLLLIPLCLCLLPPLSGAAQSVGGVPGYVRVPSATFNSDGTLFLGSSFLPRKYLDYTSTMYDAIAVYTSLTFLSFVEIDLRVTRILGLPSGSHHVVDRVPTIRFRILKEKKYIPAVAIGLHDVITSLESGAARHFGASYVVVTKNFTLPKLFLSIEASAGYGTPWLFWQNNELIGLFGGVALHCTKFPWMTLLFDYDGATANTGLRVVCFKHLILMAGVLNFNSLTASINYHFHLKKRP